MPRRKAKGGERSDVGVGVRLALPILAVLLTVAACGGDEPFEPSPTALAPQRSADRWVSYEEAEQLVDFPIQLPAYLPYGLQRQEDVRVVDRGGSNLTVQIDFDASDPSERKLMITLAERREREAGCIGVIGPPDVVQGGPAAWGTGTGWYLEWGRDGLCFAIEGRVSGTVTRSEFLEIANSVSGPPVPLVTPSLARPATPWGMELLRPPEAVELWEMNLSEGEVSDAIVAKDAAAPGFGMADTLGWYLPSFYAPLNEPGGRSFVRLDRYERAGVLAAAWNLYTPSPDVRADPRWPQEIMSAIARYENSEEAEEALALGARFYGISYCCSILSEPARGGGDIAETFELTGLGEGARADVITEGTFGQIAAVSVRVQNYIGTIIVRYAAHATDVLSHAKGLAAVLAEHLAAAR